MLKKIRRLTHLNLLFILLNINQKLFEEDWGRAVLINPQYWMMYQTLDLPFGSRAQVISSKVCQTCRDRPCLLWYSFLSKFPRLKSFHVAWRFSFSDSELFSHVLPKPFLLQGQPTWFIMLAERQKGCKKIETLAVPETPGTPLVAGAGEHLWTYLDYLKISKDWVAWFLIRLMTLVLWVWTLWNEGMKGVAAC